MQYKHIMMDDNQTLTLSLAVKLQNVLILANQLISTVSILHIQNFAWNYGTKLVFVDLGKISRP